MKHKHVQSSFLSLPLSQAINPPVYKRERHSDLIPKFETRIAKSRNEKAQPGRTAVMKDISSL